MESNRTLGGSFEEGKVSPNLLNHFCLNVGANRSVDIFCCDTKTSNHESAETKLGWFYQIASDHHGLPNMPLLLMSA